MLIPVCEAALDNEDIGLDDVVGGYVEAEDPTPGLLPLHLLQQISQELINSQVTMDDNASACTCDLK